MCLEDKISHHRLEEWAKWSNQDHAQRRLGYPSSSSEQKLPGGASGSSSGEHYQSNPYIEEVETLMTEYKIEDEVCYEALRAYYLLRLSFRACANKNNISKPTFEKYFYEGIGWMQGRLKIK